MRAVTGGRRARAGRLVVAAALLPFALAGCSISDVMSAGELMEEIDEIARIDDTGAQRRIVYLERAKLSEWYMRAYLLAPIRGALALVFGRRAEYRLDNPAERVRVLIRELPYETGTDLLDSAAACSRLGWLALLDDNPHTRVLALDGMARICRQLRLDPFAGSFVEQTTALAPEVESRALAELGRLQPSAREGEVDLVAYDKALQDLVSRPARSSLRRIRLVEELAGLFRDAAVSDERTVVEAALRPAISHCVRGLLLEAIVLRDRRLAEVRLCALEQIRTLGGPRTVPLMLAHMTPTAAERRLDFDGVDPDVLVQLRLIHYCGQLPEELASRSVQLPGRQEWEATSPVEFLARTVLRETSYYSKLRTPAIVALSWCLGRERIDPDPRWVRSWLDSRNG